MIWLAFDSISLALIRLVVNIWVYTHTQAFRSTQHCKKFSHGPLAETIKTVKTIEKILTFLAH